jgi:hypothetical protein
MSATESLEILTSSPQQSVNGKIRERERVDKIQ